MTEFIVHGIPGSPYVRAVLLALEEKAAPWRLAALPMGGHRTEAYRALQPFQKIPALTHGDLLLYETHAMLRYIDAVADGPPLVPADPRAAARVDQIIGITNCYVTPQVTATLSFQRRIAPMLGLPVDEAAVAAAIEPAAYVLSVVSSLVGEAPFMVGDGVTLADCMIAPHFGFLAEFDEGRTLIARFPNLAAWAERIEARPSMAATTWDRLIALTGVDSKQAQAPVAA
jgi:glutathione S-transferase